MTEKWTPEENLIGEAEVKLSAILTRELTSRPAISLQFLAMSAPVRRQINPILNDLEKRVGHFMKASLTSYREGGERKVIVTLDRF